MPWLTNLILGATLALEDNQGIQAKDAVQDLKVSLMGPLSGIGDSIFFILIPTILGSITAYMAQDGNPLGMIVTVVGALIPSLVKVTTPLVFKMGEVTQEVQTILDTIMPAMIPAIFTFISYKLLGRNVKISGGGYQKLEASKSAHLRTERRRPVRGQLFCTPGQAGELLGPDIHAAVGPSGKGGGLPFGGARGRHRLPSDGGRRSLRTLP